MSHMAEYDLQLHNAGRDDGDRLEMAKRIGDRLEMAKRIGDRLEMAKRIVELETRRDEMLKAAKEALNIVTFWREKYEAAQTQREHMAWQSKELDRLRRICGVAAKYLNNPENSDLSAKDAYDLLKSGAYVNASCVS